MTSRYSGNSSAHSDQLFALDATTRLSIERAYHLVGTQLRLNTSHRQLAIWAASQSACEPMQVAALICLIGIARDQGRLGLSLEQLPEEHGWRAVSEAFSIRSISMNLANTGLVSSLVDGDDPEQDRSVLVVEQGMVYLQRDWRLRHELLRHLKRLADSADTQTAVPTEVQRSDAERVMLSDGQRQVISELSAAGFGLLAGGPGTGKTTVINSLLEALLAGQPELSPRIHLLAPTGKAVARLVDSLDPAMAACVQVSTVHRLLGWLPDGRGFRHHSHHRLAAEVIIVDEASMVDLELMVLLLDALNDGCRVFLVGDPNQLSSIEPGHVFGDLWARRDPALSHCELTDQFRFSADSAITRLSRAVLAGDQNAVIETLGSATDKELSWLTTRTLSTRDLSGLLPESFRHTMIDGNPEQMLDAINQCRILCPQRFGPWGIDAINQHVLSGLQRGGDSDIRQVSIVMVTRNDYSLSLFNGDQGLMIHRRNGDRTLLFVQADAVRSFELSQLSEWVDAFAMTIHKSQGSEYDQVIVVLPEADSPLLTRELLYTAITRCRQRLVLVADEAAIRQAVSRSGRQVGQLPAWPE